MKVVAEKATKGIASLMWQKIKAIQNKKPFSDTDAMAKDNTSTENE